MEAMPPLLSQTEKSKDKMPSRVAFSAAPTHTHIENSIFMFY